MRVFVHVSGKTVAVSCGAGPQTLKWLAHVGVARYDDANCKGWLTLGVPTKVYRQADREVLDMTKTISECLADGEHIEVATSIGEQRRGTGAR